MVVSNTKLPVVSAGLNRIPTFPEVSKTYLDLSVSLELKLFPPLENSDFAVFHVLLLLLRTLELGVVSSFSDMFIHFSRSHTTVFIIV